MPQAQRLRLQTLKQKQQQRLQEAVFHLSPAQHCIASFELEDQENPYAKELRELDA